VDVQLELTTCQVETTTPVLGDRTELLAELHRLRRTVARAADDCGATLLAVGMPLSVPHEFPVTCTSRYRHIADRFGMLAHEQGISGCHVHVAVPDKDAAVRVCTGLRPWLPLLLALSANSAIYRNADTGYASWRHIQWNRWPSAGPPPHLNSAAEYDAAVALMAKAGAVLDDGMVYWDARPSAKFPTVEVRVADVPATAAETVLLATLIRAAVMTVSRRRSPVIPEPLLRATYWRCARDGIEGPTPAALTELVDDLSPALEEMGDLEYVRDELRRVLQDGNGAVRQRRAWRRRGDIRDVIAELAAATVA
jgi:carboxylate-amine ligase